MAETKQTAGDIPESAAPAEQLSADQPDGGPDATGAARPRAGRSDAEPTGPHPTRMGWVVAAFLLFWPLAVPALVLSIRTAEANGTGNTRRAKKSSVRALDFALGAVTLGVLGVAGLAVGIAAAPTYASALPPGFVTAAKAFVPPALVGPLGGSQPGDGSRQAAPASSAEPTGTAGAQILDVQVGDCVDTSATSGQTALYRIPVVPCTTAHGGEIYAETAAPDNLAEDGATPTQRALWDAADAYCYPQFAKFVGLRWARSKLLYWPIAPSEESWAGGDRRILCVVESAEPVTGSLQGADR